MPNRSSQTKTLLARAAGFTDVGLQRDHNEDSFAVLGEAGVFIVADGMGGHQAGDVASQMASEVITSFFQEAGPSTAPFESGLSLEESRLVAAIRLANQRIFEHSLTDLELRGMGTTVVGAVFDPGARAMHVAHVGDSRAYLVRRGVIQQLTQDHSLVNDYLRAMPDMTEEARAELPRNVITRALGMQENVEVDLGTHPARAGDRFLLCSDGLSGMISDAEICELATRHRDLDELCRALKALANEHGGEDNITAVVVDVVAAP